MIEQAKNQILAQILDRTTKIQATIPKSSLNFQILNQKSSTSKNASANRKSIDSICDSLNDTIGEES